MRFDHTLFHCVLSYSNVESVSLCFSESFEALSEGIQKAFWEFGGAPLRHRSDSLSAAVRNHSTRKLLTKPTKKKPRKTTPTTKPATSQTTVDQTSQLTDQFRELRLPSFRDHFQQSAKRATTANLSHLEYLADLTTLECQARRQGRIKRLMRNSRLPLEKSWDSFKFGRTTDLTKAAKSNT